jgi:tRNA-specific 2-thiouridylase
MLGQEELAHCRFPVGDMPKSETRSIAARLGLRTATKPDSQEICFVRNGDLGAYLSDRVGAANRPGDIIDASGRILGRHAGIARYTVGQRKGLGISLGEPVFVTSIDAARDRIVVGDRSELSVSSLTLEEASFVGSPPVDPIDVMVQYRAHGESVAGSLVPTGHGWAIDFAVPVEAVAPGQSAAFYGAADSDELLGGGIVASTTPLRPPSESRRSPQPA